MKFEIIRVFWFYFFNYETGIGELGTKTPLIFDKLSNHIKLSVGYGAKQNWEVMRHGTRYL